MHSLLLWQRAQEVELVILYVLPPVLELGDIVALGHLALHVLALGCHQRDGHVGSPGWRHPRLRF